MSLCSAELFSELISRDNVMIVTHRSPDGDTLGAAYALKRVYENMGRSATVVCSDPIGNRFRFISDGNCDLTEPDSFDCIVCVDTATVELMGDKFQKYAECVDYCIDHHITNTQYAKHTLLNANASSTGEYLYDLLMSANIDIDEYIAEKLYSAISFDTGCFKYSNVTPHAHRVAANLIEYGVDFEDINRRLFDITSIDQLMIEQAVLLSVERYRNNTVTLLILTQDMLKKVGTDVDLDSIAALSRKFEDTVVGISMRELPDGHVKVSFRSMDERIDVSKIAARFGGGGHKRASGCSLNISIDDAKKQLLAGVFEECDNFFGGNIK